MSIFLSYNRHDNPAVERLAQALRDRGLSLFKDDWYLSSGDHWPSELERRLATCGAVAVLIGGNGLGPWQQREVYAANQAVGDRCVALMQQPDMIRASTLFHWWPDQPAKT